MALDKRCDKLDTALCARYDKTDLMEAVRVMQEGGIVLYPTDTVWGIGCDARNSEAVKRIYALKQREDSKSMLCLLDSAAKLQGYVQDIPDMAWELLDMVTEPTTIIYDHAKNIAPNLVAEDGSIGIRITTEAFSKAMCERLHAPVVSTSANISGSPTARTFNEIDQTIKEGVDYVVKFRQEDKTVTKPSHIIKLSAGNMIKIIR